ncbi:MAG: LOG family protein [Elusimicrobiota bacterium]
MPDSYRNSELTSEQRSGLIAEIKLSRAYLQAFEDLEFLTKKDLRPVRLQLELLKPETILRKHQIVSTVVVFGSARLLSPQEAARRYDEAKRRLEEKPGEPNLVKNLSTARIHLKQSRYYDEARRFAHLVSRAKISGKKHDFVIATGGGPGVMEAANRGAFEAGSKSIGFNITLPHEQDPNPYITPGLSFQFHYFALRKMHFMMRAKALVAFPGGYGTLDELFEALTLVQTGKKRRIPIVLFGRGYWRKLINFDALVEEGMVAPDDAKLFTIVEKAEEGWEYIRQFWKTHAEPDSE